MATRRSGGRVSRALALVCAAFFAGSASAATFYDFSWTDGGSLSATGFLSLDDSVGVGEPFDKGDVLAFDLELFDGAVSRGTGHFPPFNPTFHALKGTRAAASLAIVDLYVSTPSIPQFGCDAGDCLGGAVFFEQTTVDFGSTAAARASFVFTQTTPEPGAALSLVAALVALVGMRAARPFRPRTASRRPPSPPVGGAQSWQPNPRA
jgi:hypothetical protein